MRKLVFIDAIAILFLLVWRLYISGPLVMDREGAFYSGLLNSLHRLDQAKLEWANKEQKSEKDIPTMAELLSYLGDHKVLIDDFSALGVRYTITPLDEDHPQSDVATLTKDIRFRAGFCRFYPAGSKYSIQGEKGYPSRSRFNTYFQQNWAMMVPLWVVTFVVGNAIFLVVWFRRRASRTTGSRHEGGVEPPRPDL
jgi:hypothetical protein